MKKILSSIASLTLIIITLFSCTEINEINETLLITELINNGEDSLIIDDSKVKGAGYNSKFSFRTDSLNEYAGGQIYVLNDTLKNSALRIYVDFWVKSSKVIKGDGFAASFQTDQEISVWSFFDISNYGAKSNEWINVKDSVTINESLYTKSNMMIKCFAYSPNKKSIIDYDDIKITIKKIYFSNEEN